MQTMRISLQTMQISSDIFQDIGKIVIFLFFFYAVLYQKVPIMFLTNNKFQWLIGRLTSEGGKGAISFFYPLKQLLALFINYWKVTKWVTWTYIECTSRISSPLLQWTFHSCMFVSLKKSLRKAREYFNQQILQSLGVTVCMKLVINKCWENVILHLIYRLLHLLCFSWQFHYYKTT
jgi:hypothetical protein